jgi:hypothetical protein
MVCLPVRVDSTRAKERRVPSKKQVLAGFKPLWRDLNFIVAVFDFAQGTNELQL